MYVHRSRLGWHVAAPARKQRWESLVAECVGRLGSPKVLRFKIQDIASHNRNRLAHFCDMFRLRLT